MCCKMLVIALAPYKTPQITTNAQSFQGKIAAQGTPADLSQSGIDFVSLTESDSVDAPDQSGRRSSNSMSRQSSVRSMSANSINSTPDGSAFNEDIEDDDEHEGVQLEGTSKGKARGSVAMNYYRAGAHWSVLSVLFMSFLIVQALASGADYWVSVW